MVPSFTIIKTNMLQYTDGFTFVVAKICNYVSQHFVVCCREKEKKREKNTYIFTRVQLQNFFRLRPGPIRKSFSVRHVDLTVTRGPLMLQDTQEEGASHTSPTPITLLLAGTFPYFSHRPNEVCKAIFLAGVKEQTQGNLPLRKPEGALQCVSAAFMAAFLTSEGTEYNADVA